MQKIIIILSLFLIGCETHQELLKETPITRERMITGTWIEKGINYDFIYKFSDDSVFERSVLTDKFYYDDYIGVYHFIHDSLIFKYKYIRDETIPVDFEERYEVMFFMPEKMTLKLYNYIRIFNRIK